MNFPRAVAAASLASPRRRRQTHSARAKTYKDHDENCLPPGPFRAREKLANPFRVGHMSEPRGSPRLRAAAESASRRRGREAEGGGLLNRYRVVKPYRGFESLRLRQAR